MTPVRLCIDMISSQSDMDSWTSCVASADDDDAVPVPVPAALDRV
jgi:hypothetical protein